ncbi:2OG-Fe(II) oxygenase, partial [Acinetobacter baumannii]
IHRDTGPLHADRVVTFVFYLFREPRCFSGGDLLLHDWSAEGLPRAQRFTRLHPANNRLVIFPSECWHQVLPVSCHTGDPLDARLTVHGWFHAV